MNPQIFMLILNSSHLTNNNLWHVVQWQNSIPAHWVTSRFQFVEQYRVQKARGSGSTSIRSGKSHNGSRTQRKTSPHKDQSPSQSGYSLYWHHLVSLLGGREGYMSVIVVIYFLSFFVFLVSLYEYTSLLKERCECKCIRSELTFSQFTCASSH